MSRISVCPDRSYGSGGVFQTVTVPSKLAEAIHSPSGLNATQEHADVAAAVIRYRQIGDAVAVEIAHCLGMWSISSVCTNAVVKELALGLARYSKEQTQNHQAAQKLFPGGNLPTGW